MRRDDWKGNRSGRDLFALSSSGNTARGWELIHWFY
jgi:hypothetical protein